MSQKTNKKHTSKKSGNGLGKTVSDSAGVGELALPGISNGVKFNLGPKARASELVAMTDRSDAQLRQIRLQHDATGKPYLPEPAAGYWPTVETIAGLIRYERSRAADSLPRQCASMTDVESVYFIPKEMQQYARTHNCLGAFESSNRVNVLPLLKFFFPLLKKLFAGGGASIEGLDAFTDLDVDVQRAKCLAEDHQEKVRNNAIATKDLNTRSGVEKELAEPLAAIATRWKNYEKETGGRLKQLLSGAGVDPQIIAQTIRIATAGVTEPLLALRETLGLDQPQSPSAKKAA